MRQSHLRGVLSSSTTVASASPIVPAQRAPFASTRLNAHLFMRWIEAKRRPTGKTFGQLWNATTDTEARRMLMQKGGFRLNVARTASGITVTHSLDEDLARRAGLAAIGLPVTVPPEAPRSHAITSPPSMST